MPTDDAMTYLVEDAILNAPHWPEPVRLISAKERARRLELHAIGVTSKHHAEDNRFLREELQNVRSDLEELETMPFCGDACLRKHSCAQESIQKDRRIP